MKTTRIIAAISLIAVIGVIGAIVIAGRDGLWPAAPDGSPATIATIGGPFRLASSKGGVVDSADLAGKPYGVFFGYTHCPDVCPTTLYDMSEALTAFGESAKDFRLFFITVDPERDTAALLKDYLANFDPRIEALVPTMAQLPEVAREFCAFYAKVPESDGDYAMDHTATVFLMGRDGKLAGTISFGEAREMQMAKLRRLLAAK